MGQVIFSYTLKLTKKLLANNNTSSFDNFLNVCGYDRSFHGKVFKMNLFLQRP